MITERLMGTGRWDVRFRPDVPLEVLMGIDLKRHGFGHIVVTPARLDLTAVTADADRLTASRYIGVLRERPSARQIGGPGLAMWLGDEDGKGVLLEQNDYGTTLTNWRTLLTPPGWTAAGSSPGGSFTRDVVRETAIEVLPDVCAFFGVEWKIGWIGGAWKLWVDTTANLFRTTPRAMILRDVHTQLRGTDILGIGAGFDIEQDLDDWTRQVNYYTGDEAAPTLTTASQAGLQDKDVPYRRVDGQAITMTRAIEDFGTSSAGATMAPAHFGRFKNAHESITAASTEYDITRDVQCGDFVWVYDPIRGLTSPVNEVYFRGRLYWPMKIRVTGHTWPIRRGMGVYLRRYADNDTTTWTPEWVDLTDWVDWEDESAEVVELGDLPRKATGRVRTKTVKSTVRYTQPNLTE